MKKAILFDLDDTLLDSEGAFEGIAAHQHQKYNLGHVPFETYFARFITLNEHGYADRNQLFRTMVAEFEIAVAPDEMLMDYRRAMWRIARLFEDTLEVIATLRERGYQLGIVTNGSTEMQDGKLQATGLAKLVDVALISEREGIRKPDAVIFQRAAEKLGIQPSDCIFVGDHPVNDVYGAYQVGMTTIWREAYVKWPVDLTITPHHTIRTLSELLALPL